MILNRTMGPNLLAPLLATFGLSIILRNGLQQVFHVGFALVPDRRPRNRKHLASAARHFAIGKFPLIVFLPRSP